MVFILIVFLTAFMMEGIGSYISVIGLNSTFAGNYIILAFAVMLDIAKIVTVSIVYKYWGRLSKLALCYMIPAVIVTMGITSYGAFGYLSSAFQTAVSPNKEVTTKLELLESERTTLIAEKDKILIRKQKIDDQIANLPPEMVRGRTRLMNSFKPEIEQLNTDLRRVSDRVVTITAEIPALKNANIDTQQHVGPVAFLSQSLGISMDDAIMYVILVLVFVFDPLAVMLVISGNFILKIHQEEKEAKRLRKITEEHERREFEQARELELIQIERDRVANEKEVQLASLAVEEDRIEMESHKSESVVGETCQMAAPDFGDELQASQVDNVIEPPVKKRKPKIDEPKPRITHPEDLSSVLTMNEIPFVESSFDPADWVEVTEEPPPVEASKSIWAPDNDLEDSNEIVLPESLMDNIHVDEVLSGVHPEAKYGDPKWIGQGLLNFYNQSSPTLSK